MRKLYFLLLLLSAPLALLLAAHPRTATAQQPTVNTTSPVKAASTTPPGDHYPIQPGDVLAIRVTNRPQLSSEDVRVMNDGMIRVPFIREVRAACRTERELAEDIRARFLRYQRNPVVEVVVKQFNSQPVVVIGAVNSPARFLLQRRIRLLELLTLAGGPSARAGRSIHILRTQAPTSMCEEPTAQAADEDAAWSLVFYSLPDVLRGDEKANSYVRPGDFITVLEAEQVYMRNGVNKPGVIPLTLKEPLTISRAIVKSGGTTRGADITKVQITRQASGSTTKTEILVNLEKIRRNKAEDVRLQANDVVEVGSKLDKYPLLHGPIQFISPSLAQLPFRVIR